MKHKYSNTMHSFQTPRIKTGSPPTFVSVSSSPKTKALVMSESNSKKVRQLFGVELFYVCITCIVL